MLPLLFALLVTAQASVVTRQQAAETPVEKVIQLLKRIGKQIEDEGAKEAKEYDKFACFCKEQADDKMYQIEKSDAKIKELTVKIEDLDAEITDLNTDIQELGERITEIEGKVTEATEQRDTEHSTYVDEEKDISDAIVAIRGAMKTLQDSKKELKEAKTDFLQMRSILAPVLAAVSSSPSSAATSTSLSKDLSSLIKTLSLATPAGGKPHKFEYQSNDIIGVLQDLLVTFKDKKNELDASEFELKTAFDKKVLNLENEKKFKEEEKTEKETRVEKKTEEMNGFKEDKETEVTARKADKAFRDELMSECESKAEQWDQRSKTRSEELTAIGKALEHLKGGVADNYGSNKNLVGLQQKSVVVPGAHHWVWVEDGKKATSFLQVRSVAGAALAVQRVLALVDGAASRLHSPLLAGLALKLALKADHFTKVRDLIQDLIDKLEKEATDEADMKSMCDKDMTKAVTDRDSGNLDIEEQKTTIVEKGTEINKLRKEIAGLSKDIAGLNKAVNEATELRASEKEANEKTLKEAADGKEAVEGALDVLKTFYDGAAMVQKGPGADRAGDSVSDLAPELSYEGDYKGNQDASKGILGILEVILADFDRTLSTVKSDEEEAQTDFETFEGDTKDDIKAKGDDKEAKEGEVTAAEEAITSAEDDLRSAGKKRDLALEELEKLKAMCVEGVESWAERKKKREEEIEALKGAMKILENWKD